MKIRLTNNSEVIIQANSEKDYRKAQKVADKMVEVSEGDLVVCSECEYEYWIHLTARWNNYQSDDFRFYYKEAKANV